MEEPKKEKIGFCKRNRKYIVNSIYFIIALITIALNLCLVYLGMIYGMYNFMYRKPFIKSASQIEARLE